MIECAGCKAPAPEGTNFCGFCGLPLNAEEVVQQAAAQPPAPASTPEVPIVPVHDLDVPDVIGEVVGWRAWIVKGPSRMPFLHSAIANAWWSPRDWTVAECTGKGEAHQAKGLRLPVEGCSCGIYSAKTREHLVSLGYNEYGVETRVVGEVAYAGKVIEGSQGWRGEKARIKRLYVPYEKWKVGEQLSRVYQVPFELTNTFNG